MSECNDFDFDKEICIDVDTDLSWDVCNVYNSDPVVYYDIATDLCIEGNTAFLAADVEAIGCDTLVEVWSSVLAVEDELSHVSMTALAAAE